VQPEYILAEAKGLGTVRKWPFSDG
jgi:hypothetical protein